MADFVTLAAGWLGIYGATVLAAIGSILGCSGAGQAACGALLESDTGHGRFIGIAAMPASQAVYGIVVTLALQRPVTLDNAPGLFSIGMLAGTALLVSAVQQGNCCASAIQVSRSKPEAFGLSVAPAAIVEGFAIFSLAFALLLAPGIGHG